MICIKNTKRQGRYCRIAEIGGFVVKITTSGFLRQMRHFGNGPEASFRTVEAGRRAAGRGEGGGATNGGATLLKWRRKCIWIW